MDCKIRPATAEDAQFLGLVMLLAARSHLTRGLWDVTLAAPEKEVIDYLAQLAVTNATSWGHYSNFIVAEVDGRPVAGLCGYDPKERGTPVLMQAMNEVADHFGWDEEKRNAPWGRFAPIASCLSDDHEGAWIIENVATLAEYRRRGLTDQLLHRMLETGREKGYKLAQLTVLINNDPAQKAYEKAGFQVDMEKRNEDFQRVMGEPGMRRMVRPL